jgi:hypothetical protein
MQQALVINPPDRLFERGPAYFQVGNAKTGQELLNQIGCRHLAMIESIHCAQVFMLRRNQAGQVYILIRFGKCNHQRPIALEAVIERYQRAIIQQLAAIKDHHPLAQAFHIL